MSKREPGVLLDDIRTSISKIERYTAGLDEESFLVDEKTIDAVVRNLEIIGEAAGNSRPISRHDIWRSHGHKLPVYVIGSSMIMPASI
jgi:uncharacterized protein with HEPN domain